MRIGYVTAEFPLAHGESFLSPEVAALAERVERVVVVPLRPRSGRQVKTAPSPSASLAYRPIRPFSLRVLVTAFAEACLNLRAVLRCVAVIASQSRDRSTLIKNLATVPKGLWLARIIRQERLDHVHAHWLTTPSTMAWIAAEVSKVPWSCTGHRADIVADNLLRVKGWSASFVRFISRQGSEMGVARGVLPQKVRVIPMGVQVDSPRMLPHPERRLRLLCVANLKPVKGVAELLDAVRRVLNQGHSLSVDVLGDGPERKKLEAIIAERGLVEHVTLAGFTPHDEVLRLLREGPFDCLVLPSQDLGGGLHEGVPVILMEAMAAGLPVIATRTGAVGELLPEIADGAIAEADAQSIASRLIEIVEDRGRLNELAERQRLIVHSWDIEHAVTSLLGEITNARTVSRASGERG